ncbi:MAG: response regulator [Lachnospiraceae bacterium]|nr:response regulator [Lachnospiraceae bacterium]
MTDTNSLGKVLVVDDTDMNNILIRKLLSKRGIEVDTSTSGPEAIEKARNAKYALILMDHLMPDMDGVTAFKEIRNDDAGLNGRTPCIVLTANSVDDGGQAYRDMGFCDYIQKPVNGKMLGDKVMEYMTAGSGGEEPAAGQQAENSALGTEPEWAKSIKAIKWIRFDKGIDNCGGLDEYKEALEIFFSTSELRIKEIRDFYENEDWDNYTIKVHALKSTAGIIGVMSLSLLAEEMEDAGKAGNISLITEKTEPLLDMYEECSAGLGAAFGQAPGEKEKKPVISQDMLAEAYEMLGGYAMRMDYDNMESIMSDLEAYDVPLSEKEKFDKLRELWLKMDFKGIAALL